MPNSPSYFLTLEKTPNELFFIFIDYLKKRHYNFIFGFRVLQAGEVKQAIH
jgi:hypothetical protein